MTDRNEYWMRGDAEEVTAKLISYHNRFQATSSSSIYQTWYRNSYAYYSTILDADSWETSLNFEGEKGELVKMSIPQARSLIRQLLTLITKQRLSFNAIADSTDREVVDAMRVANALVRQILDKQSCDEKGEEFCEQAMVLGTSFLKTTWRTDWGQPVGVNEYGGAVYSGDVEIKVVHPVDMLYDMNITEWQDVPWVEVRTRRNRWSLVAQFPHLADEIRALPACQDREYHTSSSLGLEDEDQVFVFEVYHRPTPALESGRMMMYSDPHTIYIDDVNRYGTIPIERMIPERVFTYGFGYPIFSSILPSQEMLDHNYSAIATNHANLGVQNITVPRGSDISVHEISGMNFMSYTPQNVPGGGKPEKLDLLATNSELFKLPEALLSSMQQITNLNAAIRGDLGSSASGVAIATLTTNALEFLNSFSRAYVTSWEKTMMHAVNAYREFTSEERLVTIAGKNNEKQVKSFVGDDLEPIKDIRIQLQNPMMQTISGRVNIADKLAERGQIKDLQQYISILDGEPLDTLVQQELSENDLIANENETMQEGTPVEAIATDNHALHIFRHKTLLNDPKVRQDGSYTALVLEHIQQHLELAKNTDPMLQGMAATGMMPEMPPPPPGAPGGEPMGEIMAPEGSAPLPTDDTIPAAATSETAEDLLNRGAV